MLGKLFVWSTIVVHTFWDIWTLRNAQQAHFLQNQRAKSNFNPCLVVATTSKINSNRKETRQYPEFLCPPLSISCSLLPLYDRYRHYTRVCSNENLNS
mmetsp:Transcript_8255/g.9632  ORF Transcript_8255/g.9632 Transcript_8255/m.9632 type:complete len:98 (+) Transcript_8255:267-560(+)